MKVEDIDTEKKPVILIDKSLDFLTSTGSGMQSGNIANIGRFFLFLKCSA